MGNMGNMGNVDGMSDMGDGLGTGSVGGRSSLGNMTTWAWGHGRHGTRGRPGWQWPLDYAASTIPLGASPPSLTLFFN